MREEKRDSGNAISQPKIKVLFVLHSLAGGGAERAVVEFFKHYDRRKYECKLLLINVSGAYLRDFDPKDLIDEKLLLPHKKSSLRFFEKIRSMYQVKGPQRWKKMIRKMFLKPIDRASRIIAYAIKQGEKDDGISERLFRLMLSVPVRRVRYGTINFKPCLIISHLMEVGSSTVYLAKHLSPKAFSEIKWIAVEHNNTYVRAAQYHPHPNERNFWHGMTKAVYRATDHVVAVSSGVKAGLISNYQISEKKIAVIYNPVDVDQIEATPSVIAEKPFILAAGRLHPQKRFDCLIKAYSQIASSVKEDLLILGEGNERTRLEELIKAHSLEKRIHLTGFRQNLWAHMKAASCFALTSDYEGLGMVLMEAMAAGCPVVSFDCDYGPRELIDDGFNGILVPAGDVEAMAAAMMRVLIEHSLSDYFAGNARQKVAKFNTKEYIEAFESLFNTFLRA